MSEQSVIDMADKAEKPENVTEPKLRKLSSEQALAAHLVEEREKRQKTILEMNELLIQIDGQAQEIVALRRALFQERLNSIAKDNADLRKKWDLPNGKVNYEIRDGEMFVVESVAE